MKKLMIFTSSSMFSHIWWLFCSMLEHWWPAYRLLVWPVSPDSYPFCSEVFWHQIQAGLGRKGEILAKEKETVADPFIYKALETKLFSHRGASLALEDAIPEACCLEQVSKLQVTWCRWAVHVHVHAAQHKHVGLFLAASFNIFEWNSLPDPLVKNRLLCLSWWTNPTCLSHTNTHT